MNKIYDSYCGVVCADCEIFIATKNDDYNKKKEIGQSWIHNHGRVYAPEEVNCFGCKVHDKAHCPYCESMCEMRLCAMQKNVNTCAHCSDYPCSILNSGKYDFAIETLDKIKNEISK